ncbi:disease resistance protein RGA5-like [Miscanthus floridulus]|uniref:disease resistance protein RGA5-like n=1 Tax=Miscanthus floridulus TaxID=154761 RepID=UPI003459CEF0
MAEMISSAATGVLGSVIDKLAAMLTDKYNLARDVKEGIRSLQDELRTMEAMLLRLEDKDDDHIDPLAKDWRSKVRELSYDIEDCIDRFVLNHSHGDGGSTANFVHKAIQMVKTLFKDRGIAEEIRRLKRLVSEQNERGKRYYDINQCLLASSSQPVLLDPRAPSLFQEARDLVGIDAPREEIISLLRCEDKEHKVVSIYGIGGQGKTTLAMEVYHEITEAAFDRRAFVSVSQTPDMKKLLRDILSQISKSHFDQSQMLETVEQLIRTVKECLKDKRYFIWIDDIWSVSAWELVRSALPVNDNGSRIITTTRIEAVAKSCSIGIAAQMYQAKPLSHEDSQRLFFKRLFLSGDDCHPDLRKVSDDILKKCCGLPLAIISIAGLLANRRKVVEVWVNVLRSIAAAVDKDSPIDKMKRILLLSYFDLPHHIKSCLLYLSVFPEDSLIDCQQLILLWVAEGLIPGQDRESMEQLGRSYLNELINRSLVQPTKVGEHGATVKQCRVHDVILEFIVSKAVEDNFVTIWNGNGFSKNSSSNKIRRLSIQKDISSRAEETAKMIKNGAQIRSINIFGSNSVLVNKHATEFLNSQVLRMLNIEGEVGECSLGNVKSLGQLKFLRIDNKFKASKLPEDIEKLQRLETLNVRWQFLEKLPASIIQLQKLVRLLVHELVRLPDGIGSLQALEELSSINLGIQSVKFIQGLGDLTNLKLLKIDWPCSTELRDMKDHKEACISMLSRLFRHLRELHVWQSYPNATCSFMVPCVPTPPPLRKLVGLDIHNLNRVGPQISSLVNLTRLHIFVRGEAGKEGINILASLPMLLSLTVVLPNGEEGDSGIVYPWNAINPQGFQRLLKFHLHYYWWDAALEFEPGAMPKLERLKLHLMARFQFKFGEGGLVLGLQNLAGLKHLAIDINYSTAVADEVEALEDDIRGAAAVHPNRPILQIQRIHQDWMAQGCSRRPSDHAIVEA